MKPGGLPGRVTAVQDSHVGLAVQVEGPPHAHRVVLLVIDDDLRVVVDAQAAGEVLERFALQEHSVERVGLTDLELVVGTPDVDGPGNVACQVGHRLHDREDDELGVLGVDELLQLLGRDQGPASLESLVLLLGDGRGGPCQKSHRHGVHDAVQSHRIPTAQCTPSHGSTGAADKLRGRSRRPRRTPPTCGREETDEQASHLPGLVRKAGEAAAGADAWSRGRRAR